jgi:hypothetical protein
MQLTKSSGCSNVPLTPAGRYLSPVALQGTKQPLSFGACRLAAVTPKPKPRGPGNEYSAVSCEVRTRLSRKDGFKFGYIAFAAALTTT